MIKRRVASLSARFDECALQSDWFWMRSNLRQALCFENYRKAFKPPIKSTDRKCASALNALRQEIDPYGDFRIDTSNVHTTLFATVFDSRKPDQNVHHRLSNSATMPISTRERFERAVEIVQVDLEADDHVLAGILCGSLAYDKVWDKSDIDLVVITTDEKERLNHGISLMAEDVNIHTSLIPRNAFRRSLEAAHRNSFQHSLYARSKLLFSKDPSIDALYDDILKLGKHDLNMQMMGHAQHTIVLLYKAKKWHLVKDDPHYTAHWILNTASCLASVVVSRAGQIVDREALVEATKLEPELFKLIYTDLFDKKISQRSLTAAIAAIDDYLEPLGQELFEPVIDYLKAAFGEPRSGTELEHYFSRNYGLEHTVTACEWLSDLGIIEKASVPTKLTQHSQNEVEELAFFVA